MRVGQIRTKCYSLARDLGNSFLVSEQKACQSSSVSKSAEIKGGGNTCSCANKCLGWLANTQVCIANAKKQKCNNAGWWWWVLKVKYETLSFFLSSFYVCLF